MNNVPTENFTHTEHKENHRVTAKMVADLSDVSVSTVSRVVNNAAAPVNPQVRERVLSVARELGYRPNTLAIGLRKGSTQTLGLLIPDIAASYFHLIVRGLEDAARSAGYTMILCNTDRDPQREAAYLDVLDQKRVDAVVFAGGGMNGDTYLENVDWKKFRAIAVGPHRLPIPTIGCDNAKAAAAAVGHLVEQGCSRIACLTGRPNWFVSQLRQEGYRTGLKRAGLPVKSDLEWETGFTLADGKNAVAAAVKSGLQFDAIVGFTDAIAVGAIQALKAAGLRIPDDVAVIGFDDTPLASVVEPTLSSVSFPLYQFGSVAMEMILNMMEGRPTPNRDFPYELRLRASSCKTRLRPHAKR